MNTMIALNFQEGSKAMIKLKINNREVEVSPDKTILDAAKEHGIDIPTLCYYPDLNINSDCRICSVEVEGAKNLLTACSTPVKEGMVIRTNSSKVLNARRTITELILANHDTNCTACVKNMKCELQSLANQLGIDENRFPSVLKDQEVDDHNPSIYRNPNRCIKCGRCVDVCKDVEGTHVLETMYRGHDVEVTPKYGKYLTDEDCTFCGQCSSVCPVAAITEKDDSVRVLDVLNNPKKHVVVQVAPSIRVSIGEEFGEATGGEWTGKLVTALRNLGFDRVFDTDFTADLTIIEEGHELLHRVKTGGTLPMMTSCCPGWINYAEQHYPDMLGHLSTCKSPQQMFGSLAKTYYAQTEKLDPKDVYVVSIMPCTAKKYEAAREEMQVNENIPDVDAVLTTRELGKMVRQMGINFQELEDGEFDNPFGITTGAAAIFGATGGVMEAALRTVSEVVNEKPLESLDFKDVRGMQGIKEAEVELGGAKVRVAVAHTLKHAKQLTDQIKAGESPYAFIEVMTCPGGCIGGGGQPYGTTNQKRQERINATYQLDSEMPLRKSHENPYITEIYEKFLKEPLGKLSHDILHTHYTPRVKLK